MLVLCAFRSTCYDFVKLLLALLPGGQRQVVKQQKFEEEYGPGDEVQDDEAKPESWKHLFDGNSDDRFKIGLAIGNKAVRLYSPFSKSDARSSESPRVDESES